MLEGPAKRYSQALETGEIEQDAAQQQAVRELQRVFDDLVRNRQPKRLFPKLFPRFAEKKVQGLYLWGGVGRGKTFLMDVFYESLPLKTKRRLHFHRFMRLVHKLLREYQGFRRVYSDDGHRPRSDGGRRPRSDGRTLSRPY